MFKLFLSMFLIILGVLFIFKGYKLSKRFIVVNYYFDGHLFQVSGLKENHKLIMNKLTSPYNIQGSTYQYFYDLCALHKCDITFYPEL